MGISIFTVDAFTNEPFKGNPAAVCLIENAAVGDLPIQDVFYSPTIKNLMICLADTCNRSELMSLSPTAGSLVRSETTGKIKSLIITVKGTPTTQSGYDFYSRVFSPWVGVPEDPVTGSAHTVLAGYWSEKLEKKKMKAYQCSSRGGELQLEMRDDGRLDIIGQARIILQGTLNLDKLLQPID